MAAVRAHNIENDEPCIAAVHRVIRDKLPYTRIHHKDFNAAIAFKRLNYTTFTILRDPVQRVVSDYNYGKYVLGRILPYDLTADHLVSVKHMGHRPR